MRRGLAEMISIDELEAMLLDLDIPDAALRPYLMESVSQSGSFEPVVRINPATVDEGMLESALLLSSLNGVARQRRQLRYGRKIASGDHLRIVSEGDSWFQYPLLLDDVIDHLSEHFAIFSLDAAGDLVADMVDQARELVAAIGAEDPAVILLSGGGNDLLGDGRLASALLPFKAGRLLEAYLADAFAANLGTIHGSWEELLATVRQVAPTTPILCHSYDHAIPTNGRWLGKPMRRLNIVETGLQRSLIQLMVDRFHADLQALAGKFSNVHVIDCRGIVRGRWHDELHPDNAGYRDVAAQFRDQIVALTGRQLYPVSESIAALESMEEAVAPTATPKDAVASWSDAALRAEIGLRTFAPPEEDNDLTLSLLSLESTVPAFEQAGAKLLADARTRGVASLGLPPAHAQLVAMALERGL